MRSNCNRKIQNKIIENAENKKDIKKKKNMFCNNIVWLRNVVNLKIKTNALV